jgi:N utilization substance protein B
VLNRRHIRVKVMQTIYAMHQSQSEDIVKQEKFLISSLDNFFDLYLLLLSSLIEIRNKEEEYLNLSKNKHLATSEEKKPNTIFVENQVLVTLANDKNLLKLLEDRKINNWQRNDDTILFILQDIKQSKIYEVYMSKKQSDFGRDKLFVEDIFTEIIAPNEKLYNYIEDFKLTWVDDLALVNTQILKEIKQLKPEGSYKISKLYKDSEDQEFASELFKKTVLNEVEFAKEFQDKTPNWDIERIAELDIIILKMAICELLKFPSIPVNVTINEYLELAKEYSTPKSSIFINGILDKLSKEFSQDNRLNKIGRGLM